MSKSNQAKQLPRDIPKILQIIRNFLLGRTHKSVHRFAEDISKRTQPFPNLPTGPATKIHGNYYYDRDPRGEVQHPQVLFNSRMANTKHLKGSLNCIAEDNLRVLEDDGKLKTKNRRSVTPGNTYQW